MVGDYIATIHATLFLPFHGIWCVDAGEMSEPAWVVMV